MGGNYSMASVIMGERRAQVKDGREIRDACKALGVPLECDDHHHTCHIEILEGAENLAAHSEIEEKEGMDTTHRLACQCVIRKGNIKITF